MDDTRLFKIGDMARLFNLSVSTLRHYEKAGLISPEYIDPDTLYRYYSVRQFETLNTIRYLRALDMPLDEIADFLRNRDVEKIEKMLMQQKDTVIKKQQQLRLVERKIDNRLRQLRSARIEPMDEISIVVSPPCRMVWMSTSLKISGALDMEGPIRELEGAQGKGLIFLGKVGVGISQENLILENYERYDGIFLVLDDEDDFSGSIMHLPQTKCVRIRFHGGHVQSPEHYRHLAEYMRLHALEPAGFSREITIIDYGITSDTEKFVTEISIPVRSSAMK